MISDQQVAVLRALLSGDDGHRAALADLSRDDNAGYSALLAGAFVVAVDRRFTTGTARSEVIGFVANVRSRSGEAADIVDPGTAEAMIIGVVNPDVFPDVDAGVLLAHQNVLAAALVADERLDAAGLDAFLAEARSAGERLVA